MKLRNTILSTSEVGMLTFLWKYRIATFRTLHEAFYPGESPRTAYDRMKKLVRGEFIQIEKILGTNHRAIILGRRGYAYLVANVLPGPKTKSYRPQQQYHDLLAMAALLGDWLKTRPSTVRIVSEQELLNFEVMEIPESVRKFSRRPDGIWIFSSGREKKGIALEVELSAKNSDRYEEICAAYASEPFFEHIVWIVQSVAHGNRILAAAGRYGASQHGHLFALQKDFEECLWASHLHTKGKHELSLADLLEQMARRFESVLPDSGVNRRSTTGQQGVSRASGSPLLNFDICLIKPTASKPIGAPIFP